MAIPIQRGPNHNVEDELNDDFTQFFDDFDEIIVGDELDSPLGLESDQSGFGFDNPHPKRRASTFWDFQFDIFSNVDDEDGKFRQDPKFSDWVEMINFQTEVAEEGDSVTCPPSNPDEVSGSGSESLSGSGVEKPPLPRGRRLVKWVLPKAQLIKGKE